MESADILDILGLAKFSQIEFHFSYSLSSISFCENFDLL